MMRILLMILALGLSACQASAGEAPPPPPITEPAEIGGMCGGLMGRGCADPGAYCRYETNAMCGAADQTGTCQIRPQMCTREYRPVCGCDGQTYSNACTAASAGVSVVREGRCEDSGEK